MKLSALLLLCLSAIPLAISARPVSTQNQLQQVLGGSPKSAPPSSVNSFSSSSDVESNSDSSTKSKGFSFSSLGKSLKQLTPNPTSEFRCHRYPTTSILSELSSYVTSLLRSDREAIGAGKGDLFPETCYAGYESTDVLPSIYYKDLKPKQLTVVEKLFKNRVLPKFPNVRIVRTNTGLAIVLDEIPGLKRRNTV